MSLWPAGQTELRVSLWSGELYFAVRESNLNFWDLLREEDLDFR